MIRTKLVRNNEKDLTKLSLDGGINFFLKIIKDFKKGKISLDELSAFGFNVFHKIAKKYPESDLFSVSLSASELNFAVRSPAVYENIKMYLEEIDDFFEKYHKK